MLVSTVYKFALHVLGYLCLIEYQSPKTVGFASSEGLQTFYSNRRKVWQTVERFSFSFAKLLK